MTCGYIFSGRNREVRWEGRLDKGEQTRSVQQLVHLVSQLSTRRACWPHAQLVQVRLSLDAARVDHLQIYVNRVPAMVCVPSVHWIYISEAKLQKTIQYPLVQNTKWGFFSKISRVDSNRNQTWFKMRVRHTLGVFRKCLQIMVWSTIMLVVIGDPFKPKVYTCCEQNISSLCDYRGRQSDSTSTILLL